MIIGDRLIEAVLSGGYPQALERLIKSPKLHFLNSGLLAAMRHVSPEVVRRDKTSFGPILEAFVFSELQQIVTWSDQRCTFSHFRDKDKNEVDIVLENRRGEIVGIEVKASATVSSNDFSGMRKLAEARGCEWQEIYPGTGFVRPRPSGSFRG